MARKPKIKIKKSNFEEAELKVDAENYIGLPDLLPILPSKEMVVFPGVMMSLFVARDLSLKAMEKALDGDKLVLVVAQENLNTDNPEAKDLYKIGTIANIVRTLQLPDGRFRVLVQGLGRAKLKKVTEVDGYLSADFDSLMAEAPKKLTKDQRKLIKKVKDSLNAMVEFEVFPEELVVVTEGVEDAGVMADIILAHHKLNIDFAQKALCELDPIKRLKIVDNLLAEELNKFFIGEQIRAKAQGELEKGQREYYLREQLHQIQTELGEGTQQQEEIATLKRGLDKSKLPKEVSIEAIKQLRRLEKMSSESGDAALLRTYLEWIIDLPWNKQTKDRLDLKLAKKILDQDHYGLEKVKDRIIEYLGVRKLNKEIKGPILCLVGPPGVGKTSLGMSIAKALERKFYRMSLGGVRDEAEIRGHRRTYVGSLPGRVLQGLKQAGTRNPVFVLDELDKVGADFRGDPASALLEVLDPHQNKDFTDHYLDVPFDLSQVIFIATANTVDTIPDALLDRLEVISIPGYTTEEKISIAQKFLIPRQVKECGLLVKDIDFSRDGILALIEGYTREAGVRNLEREIGSLCRKVARKFAEGEKKKHLISAKIVEQLLGAVKYDPDSAKIEDAVGRVTGLAWTVHGGETMEIEALVAKGSGELILTGQLGDVMQESARAAFFYARANAELLGLDPTFHDKLDVHVHVPEGATPKDGPSAGTAIVVAIVSALSGRTVSKQVAMTGEVTLRGRVLAIGGLREKALAALRQGVKKIIIPHDNIKDLEEIPVDQRNQIKFVPVKHVSEVLQVALFPKEEKAVESVKAVKTKKKNLPRPVTRRFAR